MRRGLFFALSLFFYIGMACADEFKASVANNNVVAGEPFELRLTYDGSSDIQPDLSVLQKDFQIYSNSSSMQSSYINGVISQQRSWKIGLIALKEGEGKIPPIKAGNLSSNSIDLTILPAGSSVDNGKKKSETGETEVAPKFETEFLIDKKNPYVKQEVTGTLIIKDYVGLEFVSDPVFLDAEDWTIKILEQPKVSQIANGREIKVLFSMFPLKTDIKEVPKLQWQAVYFELENEDSAHSRRLGFFDFGGFSMIKRVQKPLILQTKSQEITVKPIPQNYGNSWWIPAKALNLASKISEENQDFKVGETFSREIILSAVGVLDTDLPELKFSAPEDVKQYPENPQFSLSVYKNEPVAQATYRIVYIPQKAGEITLPEIRLKWFNTKKQTVKTAKIAEQKIKIAENPAYKEINAEDMQQKEIKKSEKIENVSQLSGKLSDNGQNSYLWLIAAFVFGMFLSYILFATKKADKSKSKTLNKISNNLKNNDYRRLRDNLIKWGNENFNDFEVNNLNDLALLIGEEDFSQEMQVLNRLLYADTKETPDSTVILNGLKNRLRNKSDKQSTKNPLPELYE